jgi:hypothetical protein
VFISIQFVNNSQTYWKMFTSNYIHVRLCLFFCLYSTYCNHDIIYAISYLLDNIFIVLVIEFLVKLLEFQWERIVLLSLLIFLHTVMNLNVWLNSSRALTKHSHINLFSNNYRYFDDILGVNYPNFLMLVKTYLCQGTYFKWG